MGAQGDVDLKEKGRFGASWFHRRNQPASRTGTTPRAPEYRHISFHCTVHIEQLKVRPSTSKKARLTKAQMIAFFSNILSLKYYSTV